MTLRQDVKQLKLRYLNFLWRQNLQFDSVMLKNDRKSHQFFDSHSLEIVDLQR